MSDPDVMADLLLGRGRRKLGGFLVLLLGAATMIVVAYIW
jgi:hypothetical protein